MTNTSREKLNHSHVIGSIAIAVFFAVRTSSSAVFIVIAGLLLTKSLASGEIRPARITKR